MDDLAGFCCQNTSCPDYGQRGGTNLVVRAVAATSLRAGAMSSFASRISVGAGASCIYLPGALIPHAGSAHVSSLAVRAADDARVLAVTVVTPGRTGMGERGSFTSLRMRATLVAGEEVLLAEDADFAPGTTPLDSEATFAGAGAVVSAVVSGDWDASTVEWWATLFADTDVAGYAGSLRGIRTRGVRVAAVCSSLGAAQRVSRLPGHSESQQRFSCLLQAERDRVSHNKQIMMQFHTHG